MGALKRMFSVLLALVILLTVAFIFYNSSLPPEQSSQQSGAVGGIIAEIIPPETELGGFIQKYIRKIAHFTEYGLLGIELAIFCVLFTERKFLFSLRALFFAGAVALVDESIQIFSKRGPSVSDIWIDIGGYVFFSLLALAVMAVIRLIFFIASKFRGY